MPIEIAVALFVLGVLLAALVIASVRREAGPGAETERSPPLGPHAGPCDGCFHPLCGRRLGWQPGQAHWENGKFVAATEAETEYAGG